MPRHGVTHTFLPPTALKSLGRELVEWGRENLGLTINEFYGQTECNMIVSIGKAVPGHRIDIVDDAGRPLPDGVEGNLGARAPDPVMSLEYWQNPQATGEKFAGG